MAVEDPKETRLRDAVLKRQGAQIDADKALASLDMARREVASAREALTGHRSYANNISDPDRYPG